MRSILREPPPLAGLTRTRSYPWLVVGTVCVGAFLGQLDASIATLILPTLEGTFRTPVAEVEWVAIAYLLVLVILLIRREPRGILLSLLLGTAVVVTGIWSIYQSRSSTAGIGFLVIPMFGALGGFLGAPKPVGALQRKGPAAHAGKSSRCRVLPVGRVHDGFPDVVALRPRSPRRLPW